MSEWTFLMRAGCPTLHGGSPPFFLYPIIDEYLKTLLLRMAAEDRDSEGHKMDTLQNQNLEENDVSETPTKRVLRSEKNMNSKLQEYENLGSARKSLFRSETSSVAPTGDNSFDEVGNEASDLPSTCIKLDSNSDKIVSWCSFHENSKDSETQTSSTSSSSSTRQLRLHSSNSKTQAGSNSLLTDELSLSNSKLVVPCVTDKTRLQLQCAKLKLNFNDYVPTSEQSGFSRKRKMSPNRDGEYEVESILDHRTYQGNLYYLVKWKNWSSEFNSWEPVKNVNGCKLLIQKYMKLQQERKRRKNNETYDRYKSVIKEICKKDNDVMLINLLSEQRVTDCCLTVKEITEKKNKILKLISSEKNGFLKKLGIHTLFGSESAFFDKIENRKIQRVALKEWEDHINSVSGEKAKITVENEVDEELPPKYFVFIKDYKAGEGITIPNDPLLGCECEDCYQNREKCCPKNSDAPFAYSRFGTLKVGYGTPIFECSKLCKCGENCMNRIVQKGRQVNLTIFRTENGRGWGVKTMEKIKKGTFVMEYLGEIITTEEAERRGKLYDEVGRTYLFDLDFNGRDCEYTVDAGTYGNIAHFVNHSCDPSLLVFSVWFSHIEPSQPRIAFFAKRDIKKGEELTFDYMMSAQPDQEDQDATADVLNRSIETKSPGINKMQKKIECKCGAENCRKFIF